MKIKTTKNHFKKIIGILGIVIIVAFLATATYIYGFQGSIFGWPNRSSMQSDTIDYSEPTEEQKQAGNDIKKQSETSTTKPSNNDTPPAPVSHPSGKSTTTIIITTPDQQQGEIFQLRTLISHVTNSGICTLNLKKNGKTITKTSGVQALASSSTCQGFDIPTNELATGQWDVGLTFENSELIAETTKTITVN